MGIFGEKDYLEQQVSTYTEIVDQHKETLDEIGSTDTPEAEQQRQQLTAEIQQAEIAIYQLQEGARRDGRDLDTEGYSLDFFGD